MEQSTTQKKSSLKAVVQIGGRQYIVAPNDELLVDKLPYPKGEKVKFESVLARFNDEGITIGTPKLDFGITTEIVDHIKGKKINIVKFKPKIRYRRKRGFRPEYTKVKILSFN